VSFFKKMTEVAKDATGLGLSADERFERAYRKGVFLKDYSAAVNIFREAAQSYTESGNSLGAHRAHANAAIYQFISSSDTQALRNALEPLAQLDQIEVPGSMDEKIAAADFVSEIQARLSEEAAFKSQDEPATAQRQHSGAAQFFRQLIGKDLQTYKFVPSSVPHESAQERYFYHEGCAAFFGALMGRYDDPERAAAELSKASQNFRQAKNGNWAERSSDLQRTLQTKRTCWFCHREMQGEGLHFAYLPAQVSSYVRGLVAKLDQDIASLRTDGGPAASVCAVCATVIQNQADDYASRKVKQFRSEVEPRLERMAQEIERLSSRINRVEQRSS
jgi:hypothetical protein